MPTEKKAEKLITVPIPLDRWFNDIAMVARLRELLDESCLQQAIAILKEASKPTSASINADPQVNSNKLAWTAGYSDALNDLGKLTRRPAAKNQTQPDEWNHLL